jgi:hypothetical protein
LCPFPRSKRSAIVSPHAATISSVSHPAWQRTSARLSSPFATLTLGFLSPRSCPWPAQGELTNQPSPASRALSARPRIISTGIILRAPRRRPGGPQARRVHTPDSPGSRRNPRRGVPGEDGPLLHVSGSRRLSRPRFRACCRILLAGRSSDPFASYLRVAVGAARFTFGFVNPSSGPVRRGGT